MWQHYKKLPLLVIVKSEQSEQIKVSNKQQLKSKCHKFITSYLKVIASAGSCSVLECFVFVCDLFIACTACEKLCLVTKN